MEQDLTTQYNKVVKTEKGKDLYSDSKNQLSPPLLKHSNKQINQKELQQGRRTVQDTLMEISVAVIYGSVFLVFFVPFSMKCLILLIASYFIRMFAVTAGYHRYFSHRSYKTSRVMQFILAFTGASTIEMGPIWWASVHRLHHRYSDQPNDPHSPVQRGLWYSHMGWIFDHTRRYNDYSNVKDLTRYPELIFLDRYFWLAPVIWAFLFFAIGGIPGILWGFVVSTVAIHQITMCVNSFGHVFGTRRYATKDNSRNNAFLAMITLGDGWHNNHHHYATSARHGFYWWEIDFCYYVLLILERLGVVWELRRPLKLNIDSH